MQLKVPPHSIEAEQAVLGGILINNDAINNVLDIISADDFYKEAHSAIYEAMVELYNQDEPIDIITVSQYLASKNKLDSIGGSEYLTSLVESVSTSAGITHHAQIIKDFSIRRRLINQCAIISEACFQNSRKTEELLEFAEQSIFEIANEKTQKGSLESINEVVSRSFKKLESTAAIDGIVTGISTGFSEFDKLTAGLQPGELIVIAGRPSMGKTAFALNIAYNAATISKKAVVFFSLEMSKLQLGIRLLGFDAEIDAARLRAGVLKDNEWELLTESANRLSELPIFIDDSSNISVLEMKAKCRRLKKTHELGLIIIDYLQLIQPHKSYESRQLEISEISRMLKALAKDLNVPVVALSQLNRRVEERQNKRPQLADLRESGAIEQDADVIAFIYRDEVYNPHLPHNKNIAEIIIAKQRNGPTGSFKLTFQKEITKFRDYIKDMSVD